MTDFVLSVTDLRKAYGSKQAVAGLSFGVKRGEIFGFLGPNGAGKTTSLRMILGLIPPDSGQIDVLGGPNCLAVTERVGYLPEERGLYQLMTPVKVISYLAALKGLDPKVAAVRAKALLEQTGLAAAANKPIKALSKGMAQKVQVLAALAHEPDLVILDEPFSGLDPVNQTVLEDLIRGLKARGATVIFSTHVMQHAERLCDRLLIIARGEARFEGTPNEAKALLPTRLIVTADRALGWAGAQELGDGRVLNEAPLARRDDLDGLLKTLTKSGAHVHDLKVAEPTLHDLFVHLVGVEGAQA
jgi:ABC-2 type transport system ATP-binding protein